jgi:hypothetical protein
MLFVCLWILTNQLLNALTNLYETWYVYHGTWAYLNGIPINPSDKSVYLYVHPSTLVRQRLGKNITADKKTQAIIAQFLNPSFSVRSVLNQ